jgi:hypothetical protein
MNLSNAQRIHQSLDEKAVVVDIGGGAFPFSRADHIIDMIPYDDRGNNGSFDFTSERFSRETWHMIDINHHEPWPFDDNFFDYAVCSHVLEDIRDPIWVCSEICRIAKAGYIEVPSRVLEQSLGVEHPCYAGFYHHKWLVEYQGGRLTFKDKPHNLHALPEAIVAKVGVFNEINPRYQFTCFEWEDTFAYEEVLNFDEANVKAELIKFADQAKRISDLVIKKDIDTISKIKRYYYYTRLKLKTILKYI